MRALALVLALSLSGVAHAADDAPVAVQPLCLSPDEQVTLAKRLEADKAALASLKADAGKVQPLPIVLAVVVGLAAGVGIGYGISLAVAPK